MVNQFAHNWNNHTPSKNLGFMTPDCALYDQAYDTLAYNDSTIVVDFLAIDSLQNKKFKINSLNLTGEAPNEIVFAKLLPISTDSAVAAPKTYSFAFSKGKIKAIQYLGNF
jgi:hypothetical protein